MQRSLDSFLSDIGRDVGQDDGLLLADLALPVPRQIGDVQEERVQRMEREERGKGTEQRVRRRERLGVGVVPEPDLHFPVSLEGLEDERGVVSVACHEDKH